MSDLIIVDHVIKGIGFSNLAVQCKRERRVHRLSSFSFGF